MNQRGMTLMEIMIVVVIIAGVMGIAISRFNKANNDLKYLIRQMTVLSRDLHNTARMNNRTFRLVFDMNEKDGHSIWVESAAPGVRLDENAFHEEIDPEKEKEKEKEKERNKDDAKNKIPPAFTPDHSLLKKPIKFPKAIFILGVQVAGEDQPFQTGRAYVYFFPQGISQEAVIQIGDKDKLHWSIAIHPITGVARVLSEIRTLQELRTQ